MTNYSNAANKENQVLKFLEYYGFTGARSAGSHGYWDIIASPQVGTFNDKALHIQAGPKSKKELEQLSIIADDHYGIFAHLLFTDRKSPTIRLLGSYASIFHEYVTIETFMLSNYRIFTDDYFNVVNKLNRRKVTTV